MNAEERNSIGTIEEEQGVTIIGDDGVIINVNEASADHHRRSQDELRGMNLSEIVNADKIEQGRCFEQILNGDLDEVESEVSCGDGSIAHFTSTAEIVECDGERAVKFFIEEVVEVEPARDIPEKFSIDNLSDRELQEISQNIRIDYGGSKMSLNKALLDITAGHSKIEQYKKGALNLHQSIDERLEEEEKRNPQSRECEVLREMSDAAFDLYLRIRNGDVNY